MHGAGSGRALGWYALALGVLVALALAVAGLQQELGLAEPGKAGVRAVGAIARVERQLDAGAGLDDAGAVIRAALVAERHYSTENPADVELKPLIASALDCYLALREAWRADTESAWDVALHGDPAYWTALHPALELEADGPVTAEDVIEAARACASDRLDRAVGLLGEEAR
jgi:hypothetical protein